jgi:nitrogen fixation/metabolism regulation signal transduction histidine kinase
MAQQIAHEIKNPLTPMKLNVQYLEKAWDDGMDQYEERMKKNHESAKRANRCFIRNCRTI